MKQCRCGSMAFNLAQEGVDQRDLCDRHYWQDRTEKAEKNIEACRESLEDSRDDVSEVLQLRKELAGYKRYDDEIKVIEAQLARHDEALAAIAAHRGQYSELEKDAARINWLETAFDRSWNGVIDSGGATYWRISGDHRNRFKNMNGATFRDAIDAAIAKDAP